MNIINLSLGAVSGPIESYKTAFEKCLDKNIVPIAATGNA
jgi:hypothetical protein